MKVQCVSNHGIRFPRKIFRLVRLRFRLSFFPGSHHVPWQTYLNTCTWVNSKTEHKNADIKTWTYKFKLCPITSSPIKTASTFLHDVSLRSVSNSKFWMPSRTLLSPSSLRDIWQQNEHQKTNRTKTNSAIQHQLTLKTQHKLKTGLGIFRSKVNQLQVVSLGISPF